MNFQKITALFLKPTLVLLLLCIPFSYLAFHPLPIASRVQTEWVQGSVGLETERVARFSQIKSNLNCEKLAFSTEGGFSLQLLHNLETTSRYHRFQFCYSQFKLKLHQQYLQPLQTSASKAFTFSEPV